MSNYIGYGEYSQGLGIQADKDGSVVIGEKIYDSKLESKFSNPPRFGNASLRPAERPSSPNLQLG